MIKILKFLARILFANVLVFVLIASSVIDFIIGLLVLTGVIYISNEAEAPIPTYAMCFIVGIVYLTIGIIIGVIKRKKRK